MWCILLCTFRLCRKLRKNKHGHLLINLSFALVGLYLSFIGASFSIKPLCVAWAVALNYSFLASLFAMAADAVLLYVDLVIVFGKKTPSWTQGGHCNLGYVCTVCEIRSKVQVASSGC